MGISYIRSKAIVQDDAQVLVCTTNTVGVMGAGVAKLFREQIPKLYYRYKKHCEQHKPTDMVPYVFERDDGKFVYCLHTKVQWWFPSKFEYVEKGLKGFVDWCKLNEIKSIAIPPLGCGNGGLTFEGGKEPSEDIKPLMEKYLKELDADVRIYCP
jgi:O-acetyl-ADP-ribose deacetylase (regulator of RNase III)